MWTNAQVVAAAFEPPLPVPDPEDGLVPFAFGVALGLAELPEAFGFAELPESPDLLCAGVLAELPESVEPEPEPESDPELVAEPESDEDEDDDPDPDPPASTLFFESLRLSVR